MRATKYRYKYQEPAATSSIVWKGESRDNYLQRGGKFEFEFDGTPLSKNFWIHIVILRKSSKSDHSTHEARPSLPHFITGYRIPFLTLRPKYCLRAAGASALVKSKLIVRLVISRRIYAIKLRRVPHAGNMHQKTRAL